ncbi:phenolic glucoside malonyltransferase 1-like [Momordica charantia]|uniref:Phenolic glucoside malonyltransferase 1-like n=1 Tax=Momordica charantia TaxID=3673 RepID=A0A6J1DXQ9_MOMCH|nr:phenolic glucoside malonyltransferase 1-like [Momordica charantia]
MKGSSADKIGMIFAMDARARLEPPVPPNYFGNCLVARPKFLERFELSGENGMVCAVEAIWEAIKSVEEEGALKGAENLGMVIKSAVTDDETPLVSIGGSPRFGVYGTDFGWGKPRKVEMVSIEITRAFSLAETGSGDGGIEIGFVRETNEVQSFVALFAEGLTSL